VIRGCRIRCQLARCRIALAGIVTLVAILFSIPALAVIQQGDLSIFGYVETREAGRWGEGSSGHGIPTFTTGGGLDTIDVGRPTLKKGGSFAFDRWDLVEARQILTLRPDYHIVKNYKLLGRFDTVILKDADFFAYYRTWYDAEGSLKSKGRVEPFEDYSNYTQRDRQERFFRDDLHEYYAQLNFTDNFSMRIGKQQIIWSEASLLSGTEITNPGDVSYHGFVGAEAPEDVRKGLRMVKGDYLFPDFLGSVNNELEGFWIPGDFEGASALRSNLSPGLTQISSDPRDPYTPPVSLTGFFVPGRPVPFAVYNQEGQLVRISSLLDLPAKPMVTLNPTAFPGNLDFTDYVQRNISSAPSNTISNSEFGARFSTLLPVGNGLQTSFIFLYEARSPKAAACGECAAPPGYFGGISFNASHLSGTFFGPGVYAFGFPRAGIPKAGTVLTLSTTDYRRNPYFGVTGTYYDDRVTDSVIRYDALYAPRVAIIAPVGLGGNFSKWTELTRVVLAVDRPTMVPLLTPLITKQHTLLSLQGTETFYPDLPPGAVPNDPLGKIRRWSSFVTFTASDFLFNGAIATVNGVAWDVDDQAGQLLSDSSYRYSRNILLGLNVAWYLGRSGRHTDPFLESKSQRINELEFTISYEI
jgi:hypothetical protein